MAKSCVKQNQQIVREYRMAGGAWPARKTDIDDTGRRVRLKHVARMKVDGEQGSWWGDIRTMSLNHMQLAVAFKRRGIVAECRQMSNDVRYFNTLHPDWEPIQLVLNFTQDVRELDQGRKDDRAA